jgi:hypothetical protein
MTDNDKSVFPHYCDTCKGLGRIEAVSRMTSGGLPCPVCGVGEVSAEVKIFKDILPRQHEAFLSAASGLGDVAVEVSNNATEEFVVGELCLSKTVPQRKKTAVFSWIHRNWMSYADYIKARKTMKLSTKKKCWWCRSAFNESDILSLASARKPYAGNKLICVKCTNEALGE